MPNQHRLSPDRKHQLELTFQRDLPARPVKQMSQYQTPGE